MTRKEELEIEIERLDNVINNLECWGPNAESLQRDYDFLLKEYNEILKG